MVFSVEILPRTMAYRLSKVSFIPDNSVSFYSIEFYRMSWRLKRGEDFNVFFFFSMP